MELKPLSIPVDAPLWIAESRQEGTEREYYNIDGIRNQMLELEQQLEAGMISDETYDHLEERLLHRLVEAREYHRQQQFEGPMQ